MSKNEYDFFKDRTNRKENKSDKEANLRQL